MIDSMDERIGMGEWSDEDFNAHLEKLAEQEAEEAYWSLRYRELQVPVAARVEGF